MDTAHAVDDTDVGGPAYVNDGQTLVLNGADRSEPPLPPRGTPPPSPPLPPRAEEPDEYLLQAPDPRMSVPTPAPGPAPAPPAVCVACRTGRVDDDG
ncbi:serine/threonine-protein phosphatase, partial [Streptomyces sp. TRM76130]|nr:serine/threonine-protein phosphatase [Streptomyces sp. TRM76130]